MIQMVDKPNTTPIGQDRETLTFKALLYLNVAVHARICACRLYIPLFSLVQLGYPAISSTFAVNYIFRDNGVFAIEDPFITNIFSVLCYFVIAGCHCI